MPPANLNRQYQMLREEVVGGLMWINESAGSGFTESVRCLPNMNRPALNAIVSVRSELRFAHQGLLNSGFNS